MKAKVALFFAVGAVASLAAVVTAKHSPVIQALRGNLDFVKSVHRETVRALRSKLQSDIVMFVRGIAGHFAKGVFPMPGRVTIIIVRICDLRSPRVIILQTIHCRFSKGSETAISKHVVERSIFEHDDDNRFDWREYAIGHVTNNPPPGSWKSNVPFMGRCAWAAT